MFIGASAHYSRFYLDHDNGFEWEFVAQHMQDGYRNTAKENMMKFCKEEDIILSQDDIDNYEPYYFLRGPHIIYEGTHLDDRDMGTDASCEERNKIIWRKEAARWQLGILQECRHGHIATLVDCNFNMTHTKLNLIYLITHTHGV